MKGKREEDTMSLIHLESGAGEAIRLSLAAKESNRPIRIELHSTGCCDASLGLCLDEVREADLIYESDGLQFVMSPEIHQLAGDVTIACVDDQDKVGFVIRSAKPVSEWDGFGVCHIRT